MRGSWYLPEIDSYGLEQLDEGSCARAQGARLVVDDVEVTADSQAAEPERTQSARRKLASDGVDRDEGDPQTRHHRLLDRFCVAELHGRFDVPAGSLQRPLGDLTRGGALFTDEQSLTSE